MTQQQDSLKPIAQEEEFALYQVSPNQRVEKDFEAYVLSTPETRRLCTDPFVVGCNFRGALRSAIGKALAHTRLSALYQDAHDEQLNVLHLLRGGLNFPILDALGDLGKGNARASFMSSQRSKRQGTWIIQDDQYVKLTLADDSVLFVGDIVATGTTLKVMLAKLAQMYGGLGEDALPDFAREYAISASEPLREPKRIAAIVLFTIGGEEASRAMRDYHTLFKNLFPEYRATIVVFIEGIFHMANSETAARIKIEGTDLIPWRAVLSPDFERHLAANPLAAMERCVVYDGGSRGFYPSHHYEDVLEYTMLTADVLSNGASLYELLLERWEGAEYLTDEQKSELKRPGAGQQWVEERKSKIAELLLNH